MRDKKIDLGPPGLQDHFMTLEQSHGIAACELEFRCEVAGCRGLGGVVPSRNRGADSDQDETDKAPDLSRSEARISWQTVPEFRFFVHASFR